MASGLELIEVTFSVPGAVDLVRELLAERRGGGGAAGSPGGGGAPDGGPPWIGMGTVTSPERAEQALDAGAEFLVTPNLNLEVARMAREAGVYLAIGALTTTEIVAARDAGADLVKVYPLPPVGGPSYLSTVRQPLSDIPMLAAGGFGVEEIPAYRQAGAVAFGIGAPLLAADDDATRRKVQRALQLARGDAE